MPTKFQSKQAGRIKTCWAIETHDVWGNADDGYDVNCSYSQGTVTAYAGVTRFNVDTPHEFKSAALSDNAIRRILGVSFKLDIDGDDLHYYVNRASDGYPLATLSCVSHESLSPIRPVAGFYFPE